MPESDFSHKLKGVCKQCGFEFRSICHHLHYSPKCREKYETVSNLEYILSGPCRSCGRVFKRLSGHLARAPQCMAVYNVQELMDARKLVYKVRRRKYSKEYYAANSEKCRNYIKMHYKNNHEQINKYRRETKVRRKAVKKWKLDNQEKK